MDGPLALFSVWERHADGHDGEFPPSEGQGAEHWCERMNQLWQISLVSLVSRGAKPSVATSLFVHTPHRSKSSWLTVICILSLVCQLEGVSICVCERASVWTCMCALNRVGLAWKSIFWGSWLWAEEKKNPETSQSAFPLDASRVHLLHPTVLAFYFLMLP